MFSIFNRKQRVGDQVIFKIDGMHCTSCSMNIDGELEDTPGVISARTSYPQSKTTIMYDSSIIGPARLKKIIESLQYKAIQL